MRRISWRLNVLDSMEKIRNPNDARDIVIFYFIHYSWLLFAANICLWPFDDGASSLTLAACSAFKIQNSILKTHSVSSVSFWSKAQSPGHLT